MRRCAATETATPDDAMALALDRRGEPALPPIALPRDLGPGDVKLRIVLDDA